MFKTTIIIASLTLSLIGVASAQDAGRRSYDYDRNDVDYSQQRSTTVYTTEPSVQPNVTVRRYYDSNADGRYDQTSTTYYINDRGERVYYASPGVSVGGPEPQGRVHYGSDGFGSAYDVHVHGNRDQNSRTIYTDRDQRDRSVYVDRDRTVYVDRDPNLNVYGNPSSERIIVDRYYVAPPTERVIVHEPRIWRGENLEFRGELVGLNRVWSEANRGYTTLATIRQGDGRLIDFHVRNWKDLELNTFALGDVVTIRADARDSNGRNFLVLDEINRR